ncbi:hypothetical protein [Streptomyces sp. NPDC003401]
MRRPTVRRPLNEDDDSGTAGMSYTRQTPRRANDGPHHELNAELNPELVNR